MQRIVTEEELDSVDIREFHQIWAVTDSPSFSGVEIKPDKRLAEVVSPDRAATERIINNLLIVVDDPEDMKTVNRLKKYVSDRLGRT